MEKAVDFTNPFHRLAHIAQKAILRDSVFENRGSFLLAPCRNVDSTHCITGVARIVGNFGALYELMRESTRNIVDHTIPCWRNRLASYGLLEYDIQKIRPDPVEGFVGFFRTTGDDLDDLEELACKYYADMRWCHDHALSPPKCSWVS